MEGSSDYRLRSSLRSDTGLVVPGVEANAGKGITGPRAVSVGLGFPIPFPFFGNDRPAGTSAPRCSVRPGGVNAIAAAGRAGRAAGLSSARRDARCSSRGAGAVAGHGPLPPDKELPARRGQLAAAIQWTMTRRVAPTAAGTRQRTETHHVGHGPLEAVYAFGLNRCAAIPPDSLTGPACTAESARRPGGPSTPG